MCLCCIGTRLVVPGADIIPHTLTLCICLSYLYWGLTQAHWHGDALIIPQLSVALRLSQSEHCDAAQSKLSLSHLRVWWKWDWDNNTLLKSDFGQQLFLLWLLKMTNNAAVRRWVKSDHWVWIGQSILTIYFAFKMITNCEFLHWTFWFSTMYFSNLNQI